MDGRGVGCVRLIGDTAQDATPGCRFAYSTDRDLGQEDVSQMGTPEFTAELALYASEKSYRQTFSGGRNGAGQGVVPQMNLLRPQWNCEWVGCDGPDDYCTIRCEGSRPQ